TPASGSTPLRHRFPGFCIMLARATAQGVQTAMDIGIFVFVIISADIEHTSRLLRTGGVVEVNQRMTVHALTQDREILAKRGPIDPPSGYFVHELLCSMRRFAPLYSRAPLDRHLRSRPSIMLPRKTFP